MLSPSSISHVSFIQVEVQFIDVLKERSMQAENNIKSLLPKLRRLPPTVS